MKLKTSLLILFFTFCTSSIIAQTISEKKAGSVTNASGDMSQEMHNFLNEVNHELAEAQEDLRSLYAHVNELYQEQAPECAYSELLDKINEVRSHISMLENTWRAMGVEANSGEEYALWHQPETTLGQLVIDFGSQDFVYLMSPDIASIKVSINSNIPIPRSSWNEMLELILAQNGVGIKQLNPFLRTLYLLKQDRSYIQLITNQRTDLELIPNDAKAAFVLTPEPQEAKRAWVFLDKFINPETVVLQMVGRDILIIGTATELKELLKLYDFVSANKGDKEYKIVPLRKVNAEDMAKILSAVFDQFVEEAKSSERSPPLNRPRSAPNAPIPIMRPNGRSDEGGGFNGLKVLPLAQIAQALFLIGTKEEIRRASEIICEVEGHVGVARDKVIYSYKTKHSDAEELANVLQKIYTLMVQTSPITEEQAKTVPPKQAAARNDLIDVEPPPVIPQGVEQAGYLGQPFPPRNIFDPGYYLDNRYVVDPRPRDIPERDPNTGRDNFIVDLKTGAIVMVVEADILPKLKELIKRLDVPKKMVQIEVLLFEKRLTNSTNFGLNLLRIGGNSTCHEKTGFDFFGAGSIKGVIGGITQFFASTNSRCGIPAFDLIYQFFLTQEDIQINSAPSVLTMNQTPARIDLTEEISIDTGIYEIPATGDIALKRSFARARYGIKIEVTPTIHMAEGEDDFDTDNYVNLLTNISFETIQPDGSDRPPVTNRAVTNEVRIPDGQSVIIGGLRRKNYFDRKEGVPFLGELPGIGKLFSYNQTQDQATDMFILITPKIIVDPSEDLNKLRCEEMARRPGDIPYFLCQLVEAREMEKNRLLGTTMKILFGREEERCIDRFPNKGAYDGCE